MTTQAAKATRICVEDVERALSEIMNMQGPWVPTGDRRLCFQIKLENGVVGDNWIPREPARWFRSPDFLLFDKARQAFLAEIAHKVDALRILLAGV